MCEYCSEEAAQISNRYEISSVYARGMAVSHDGRVCSGEHGEEKAVYIWTLYSFDCREGTTPK